MKKPLLFWLFINKKVEMGSKCDFFAYFINKKLKYEENLIAKLKCWNLIIMIFFFVYFQIKILLWLSLNKKVEFLFISQ